MLNHAKHITLLIFAFIYLAQFSYAEVWNGSRIYQHDAPNVCAITFDDGPSRLTEQVLQTLKRLNIRATFFVLGSQVRKHPNIMKKIIAEGHEIASHSYSHRNFRKISITEQYEDLNKTNVLLKALGVVPTFFRPPYGQYNSNTRKISEKLGLIIILWSSDSRDWKELPSDYANINNILGRQLKPTETRGIFLFHDTVKNTVNDLPYILHKLYISGCRKFVTVSEYVSYTNQTIEQQSPISPNNVNVWQAHNKNVKVNQNYTKFNSTLKHQMPLKKSNSHSTMAYDKMP